MIGRALADGCAESRAQRVLHEGANAALPPEAPDDTPPPVEADPPGFLDAFTDTERAMPEMNERLNAMAALIVRIGELAAETAPRTEAAKTFAHRVGIMNRWAKELTPLVRQYDQELLEFEGRVATISLSLEVIFEQFRRQPGDADDRAEFLRVLKGMGAAAKDARDTGVTSFRDSLRRIENLSREARPVVRLAADDLDRTIAAFSTVATWGDLASDLLAAT